jgi:hypothetical protein
MKITKQQAIQDAAWKQVYRAMSYLVRTYGHAEDEAIFTLGDAIRSIRGEMCASL